MEDNNFVAAFQANREPAAEVRILPGDTLLTECVYSTAGRSVPTHGGLSTQVRHASHSSSTIPWLAWVAAIQCSHFQHC